ncbi:hypothetical protein BDZ91DRAFT_426917 [Kalaharituber pfeilii]|nr:hypothetical protein BDZ91DRAFT_426917 [Kalaharituber pfeilii]
MALVCACAVTGSVLGQKRRHREVWHSCPPARLPACPPARLRDCGVARERETAQTDRPAAARTHPVPAAVGAVLAAG